MKVRIIEYIEKAIHKLMIQTKIPGLAIAIVIDRRYQQSEEAEE